MAKKEPPQEYIEVLEVLNVLYDEVDGCSFYDYIKKEEPERSCLPRWIMMEHIKDLLVRQPDEWRIWLIFRSLHPVERGVRMIFMRL